MRKTPPRSCNSKGKGQQTLTWSKRQCFETIEYYADVSSYYDESNNTDAENDYDSIDLNRFPRPAKGAGHDETSDAGTFIHKNATLQTQGLL